MSDNFFLRYKELISRTGLVLMAFVLAAVGFGLIADNVGEGDTLGFDRTVLLTINKYSTPWLDSLFVTVTDLGDAAFLAVVTLLIAGYLIYRRHYLKTFLLLAAVGGAGLINFVLKLIFERSRPELWERLVSESSFSFPSGHAMGSSAFAFAVTALLWNTRWRWPALILASLYVLTIGLSRLYLGVHYPTDIVGGWLVSLAWVSVVGVLVYSRIYRQRRAHGLPKQEISDAP